MDAIKDTLKLSFVDAPEDPICMMCNATRADYRFSVADSDIEAIIDTPTDGKPVKLSMKLRGDWYICEGCRDKFSSGRHEEFAAWLLENAEGNAKAFIRRWEHPYQAIGAIMGIYSVLRRAIVGMPECIKDRAN